MKITKWKPVNKIDHFIDNSFFPYFSSLDHVGLDMAVDVYEKMDNVIAKMSLSGVKADEIDISIEDNILTISGSREEESETDEKDYYSKEIRRGSFSRSVSLPKSVNAEKSKASYKKGELSISMPITKGVKDNSIKVKIAS